ncbi:Zinc finger, TTF-type [Corchorus capsularis]|uniref:Zinc finger, TTF-type n=1 Tax=Corchorus capsularis TaxID=210143 RepID=A0A1R3GQ92_COCAP|nr:Zinc finger, TTF-type [Corchorus capsularis]
MSKQKKLDFFFKKRGIDVDNSECETETPTKSPRVKDQLPNESPKSPPNVVEEPEPEMDPGLRRPMWEHPVNKRDEIRRYYLMKGPYQIHLSNYPLSSEKHPRYFQYSWFDQFHWLEYSPTTDLAYCQPCYLFNMKSDGRPGWDVFTIKGFRNWKKVKAGKECAFRNHIGDDPCSPHNNAVRSCEELKKQAGDIDKVMHAQTSEQIRNNQLRLKTSIDVVRWLAFQACAFRAHRLQLTVVAASREVPSVHEFFNNLTFIINCVDALCKRRNELHAIHKAKIERLVSSSEIVTGKGANHVSTLQRAGDTRWGSNYYSICSLLVLFDETCSVLENIKKDGSTYSQRGDVSAALNMIESFEFIFILHLMKELMGISDILCALQQKSQDILNAMHLVSSTKMLIEELREEGWNGLLENVNSFCENHDLSAQFGGGRRRRQQDQITIEHHYHFDIFNVAIDFQLQELNNRFNVQAMDLLTLSSTLDPREKFKSFNIDKICTLAEKHYHLDFTEFCDEKNRLKVLFKSTDVSHKWASPTIRWVKLNTGSVSDKDDEIAAISVRRVAIVALDWVASHVKKDMCPSD